MLFFLDWQTAKKNRQFNLTVIRHHSFYRVALRFKAEFLKWFPAAPHFISDGFCHADIHNTAFNGHALKEALG